MKCNFKKVLFGLSVSLVLAMAIGSFALSETQTPANTQLETQSVAASNDGTGNFAVSGDTSGCSFSGSVLTISGGSPTISMAEGVESTSQTINVTGSATITLAGVNISASTGAAMSIGTSGDVTVLLADGYTNILTATSDDYAGLHKGDGGNTLTIGVPSGSQGDGILNVTGGYGGPGIGNRSFADVTGITITGGKVIAKGGEYAAGIGGGYRGSGSNITISGGVVEAYAGKGDDLTVDPAGIGAGYHGSAASGNSISGNAVVMVASAGSNIDALRDCDFTNGITFKGYGETFDTGTGRVETVKWDTTSGNMLGNVTLSQDVNIPVDLTIPAGQTLSIKEEKEVTLSEESGAKWTVKGTLQNDGTVTLPDDLTCNDNGIVTTKTDFYLEGQTTVYKTGYQTYQTSAGVQKYKDLPNPDQTFINWYYVDQDGRKTKIDENSFVALNAHSFYENLYAISIAKQGEGEITPNVTEAAKDDTVTFEATPADGYQLKEGSLIVTDADGNEIQVTEKDGKYAFTMPDSAVTISAVFEQIPDPTPTPPGPEPTPTPPGPEPSPTPEPTPDPSVDPDGGDGSGSGASSKTSDPFMGGIALALLGVATTGAILTPKFK